MISINPIILCLQVVNFLVSLALINWLIIRPIRNMLSVRRAHNEVLRSDAATQNAEALCRLESYEARIAQARATMAAGREQAKVAAGKEALTRTDAASAEARNIRKDAVDSLRAESADARRELAVRVPEFAGVALDRMLGAR